MYVDSGPIAPLGSRLEQEVDVTEPAAGATARGSWERVARAWRAGQAVALDGVSWALLAADPAVAAEMVQLLPGSPLARVRLIHATAEADPASLHEAGPRRVWVAAQAWVGLPTYARLVDWPAEERAALLAELVREMLVVLGPQRTRKHVLSLPSLLDMVGREVHAAEREAVLAALVGSSALDPAVVGALGPAGADVGAGWSWAEDLPPAVAARLEALLEPARLDLVLRDAALWPAELAAVRSGGPHGVPLLRLLHLGLVLGAPGLWAEERGAERHLVPDVVAWLVDALPVSFWPELRVHDDPDLGWRERWLRRLACAHGVAVLIDAVGLQLGTLAREGELLGASGRSGEALAIGGGAPGAGAGRTFAVSLEAARRGSNDSSSLTVRGAAGAPVVSADAAGRHLGAVLRAAELWTTAAAVERGEAPAEEGVVVASPAGEDTVYVGAQWWVDRTAQRAGRALGDGRERLRVVFAVDRRRLGQAPVGSPRRLGQRADGRAVYSLAEDGTLLLVELVEPSAVH